jgi:signal transduction histidine kinase
VSIERLFWRRRRRGRPYLRERRCVLDTRQEADLPPLEVRSAADDPGAGEPGAQTRPRRCRTAGASPSRARVPRPDSWRELARISVDDEGPGVRSEHLPDLFKPFFTTKADGHGLGLAVSHNIVLEHGGTIAGGNRADAAGASFEVRCRW